MFQKCIHNGLLQVTVHLQRAKTWQVDGSSSSLNRPWWISSVLSSCDWWLMCTDIWAEIETMTSSSDDEQMNKKIDEQWRGWAAEVNKLRLTRDSWAAVSKWTRSWWAADQQQQRWAVLDNLAVLKSRCVAAVLISSIDQQQIEETSDEVM